MAVTATAVFVQTPKRGMVQVLPADASALKTVVTAGANGTKVTSLMVSSSDTAARDVQWGVSRSATFYPIGTVTIPITAGQVAGTPPVDLFSSTNAPGIPVDHEGNPYIFLESGDTLDAKTLTTVTVAKAVSLSAVAAHF